MRSLDFEKQVLLRSHKVPVVVQFSSPGCGPCLFLEKQMIAVTQSLVGKIEFVSLALKEYPELALKYQIKSNPSLFVFIEGKTVARITGALPDYAIKQWVEDQLDSKKA